MSRVARSVFVFGIYLCVLGVMLVIAPNFLLTLFGLASTNDVWIRVLGTVAFWLGIFYVYAARFELEFFFTATVYARATEPLVLLTFVLLGWVGAPALLFGLLDLGGAVWTAAAMRQRAAELVISSPGGDRNLPVAGKLEAGQRD